MKTKKISVMIPCYNEEKSIRQCIISILNQTQPADEIVIVNDGSTDRSLEVLQAFGDQIVIVDLEQNTGNKSKAQEAGLRHITGEILITTDADTVMDKQFIEKILTSFDDPKVIAVCGRVESISYNWLTACRELNYVLGQSIFKNAQSYMNTIIVIPGCAGAFRFKEFMETVEFDHDTLTEDMDFTCKFHRNQMLIKYSPDAIVYTQDPADLMSYIKQMRRWYGGGYQNLLKHLPYMLDRPIYLAALGLNYFEALLVSPLMLFVMPFINFKFAIFYYLILLIPLAGIALFGSITRKRFDILLYLPAYLFVYQVNVVVCIQEFIKAVVLRRKQLVWFQPERREI